MLTEADLLLLAAAADGDLTPDQAKAVRRLLAERPDAARVLEQLKANVARLDALPRRTAPSTLASRVMARVNATQPVRPKRKPRRTAAWLPYAVAASVLVAVGGGSFLFFRTHAEPQIEQVARANPTTPATTPQPEPLRPVAYAKGNPPPADAEWVAKAGPDLEPLPPPTVVAEKTPDEPKVLGAGPAADLKPIVAVEMKLPVLAAGTTFDQPDVRAKLEKELGRDPAYRLDLFSKSPVAALEQLQAAARNAGVNVFVDAAAAELLKKPLGLPFAVYFENLTPAELANLLAETAKQVNAQPNPETVLGQAALIPAAALEQKEVKDLIGVEIGAKPVAKPSDEPKPVSADTLPKVTAAIKKSEKAAVVVAVLPPQLRPNPAKSAEIKQFVDKRGERKPGTVPLLVVVR